MTEKTCRWTEDEDGYWDTACGPSPILFHNTPTKSEYRFCPYCGARLEAVPFEEPPEENDA